MIASTGETIGLVAVVLFVFFFGWYCGHMSGREKGRDDTAVIQGIVGKRK